VADKRRTLDLEEVQAALDRAAWKARHGTAEERSGRFLLGAGRSGEDETRDENKGESDAVRGKK
jgi:hypothetical protein